MANKILYLITQSEWGGAQKYIFDLAKSLKNQSEIIVVAGEGAGELFRKCENENIRTHQLKYLKRAINPLFDFFALFELIKLIKKEKPNIIHLNSSKISILGSLAAKLIIGNWKFVIYTVHGWVFNEPLPWWHKKIYFVIEKFTAKFKDKIICVSEYDKNIAIKNNICQENKLNTIHNGIDYENLKFLDKQTAKNQLFNLIETRYKIQDTRYTIIGTVANLYKTKGINYLIDAASRIIKQNSQVLFMVIGDGLERKNLEHQINRLNLRNNFFLLGNINNAYQYLKAFNIFVLPSVKEGLPYTILEALAAKLPVIATKVGGIPEIIHDGINGLLVEPKNSATLQQAIQRLLNNPLLNQQLISHINLDDFSLDEMVRKTTAIYES